MDQMEIIAAVSRMQRFLLKHMEELITLDMLAQAAGYSKYHALRIFQKQTHMTPFAFLRAIRLTSAAQALQNSPESQIIHIALDKGFDSHDGFTRAFARQFGITPRQYSQELPPVCWYIYHPIEHYFILREGVQAMQTEKVSRTVTVSQVERPARKLIYLRYHGSDYFAACEEVGCEWEGFYNSIPEKFDTAAGGRLPDSLIQPGKGEEAFFVEVPLSYNKPVPAGYEVAELPPCTYLYFNGQPFADGNDFPLAIGIVDEAIGSYPFARFGWKISHNAPYLGMGAEPETGARIAVPVEKI